MNLFVHATVLMTMIVIQSALLVRLPGGSAGPDFLLLGVVYFSVRHASYRILPGLLVMGFLMDSLSSGPFGIYATVYFWLFVFILRMIAFVQVNNPLLLPVLGVFGVLLQNLILYAVLSIFEIQTMTWLQTLKTISIEALWILLMSPFIFYLFQVIDRRWPYRLPEVQINT